MMFAAAWLLTDWATRAPYAVLKKGAGSGERGFSGLSFFHRYGPLGMGQGDGFARARVETGAPSTLTP
jgi:hypothetical protein